MQMTKRDVDVADRDNDANKDTENEEGNADHVVAKVAGGTSHPRQGADSTLLKI